MRDTRRRALLSVFILTRDGALTTAALISPLCALSVSLFSARVGQHMILLLVAAPLLALARPRRGFGSFACQERPKPFWIGGSMSQLMASATFSGILWVWHSPAPYAGTFANPFIYWAMHLSLFGAALWLWTSIFEGERAGSFRSIATGLFITVQMGLLGALLTLAPRPLFTPHLLTTMAWHLTPLEDQQLGGVIMWVPGCGIFLWVALRNLWCSLVAFELRKLRASTS